MIEDLGICKGSGEPLCQIRVGRDQILISRTGKMHYASLNNRIISASKDLLTTDLPTLFPVITELCKRAGMDHMKWLPTTNVKKDNKMISDAMKVVKENLRPTEIFVLETVQDEIQDQLPKEASKKRGILSSLSEYQNSIKDFETTINNIRESSDILLKTVLAKQMWGSKDVMDIINNSRTSMTALTPYYEKIEACFERSDTRVGFIKASFERRIASEQVRNVVSKSIEDFSFLKSFMSKLAQNLQPLYAIDKEFKSRVGYPATWFFNPTTFMDFTDEYENLVRHVIKSASIESEIFEPLLVWKMTGVA